MCHLNESCLTWMSRVSHMSGSCHIVYYRSPRHVTWMSHMSHSGDDRLRNNSSEATSECGLGNRENPSEPTTPLPSPQYGKSQSSKISGTFCWLNFYDFLYLVAPDEKSETLSQSFLVAPDEKSENLSQSYLVSPDEKSEKLSQQKVPLISLASAFPNCGLGRGVVGSEGFSRFPSPHSLAGSDGFVPMSIVPTVTRMSLVPHEWFMSHMNELCHVAYQCHTQMYRMVWMTNLCVLPMTRSYEILGLFYRALLQKRPMVCNMTVTRSY